jgi:hypothetical protein
MVDYEQFIDRYSRNKSDVQRVENDEDLSIMFPNWIFRKFTLPNYQHLNFEGLLGRICSASYMPQPKEQFYPEMKSELKGIFEKYQENDQVTLIYETNVYLGSLVPGSQ